MKMCSKCGQQKELTEFYTDKTKADGFYSSCKTCHKASRKPANRVVARASNARYKKTTKGLAAKRRYQRGVTAKHPERTSARRAIKNALITGRIQREPCFVCGMIGAAHHSSYAKDMRLAVTWLCMEHHNALHIEHSKNMHEVMI